MSDMSHDERDAEGRSRLEVEAAFADIVARWNDESATPIGSWPVQEDVDPAPESPTDPPAAGTDSGSPTAPFGPAGSVDRRRRPPAAYDGSPSLAASPWTPREEPAAEIEGYVPPEPPPLPRGDALGWLAWVAVLGGPLFLFFASLWWTDVPRFWILIAVLAFIAGFAAIVARLPNHRSDDGPDDGAVV